MDTFKTLNSLWRGRLAPVGNTVRSGPVSAPQLDDYLPGYTANWLGSGTESLALAMLAAKQQFQGDKSAAEVILPGYACPDLLSAAVFAGLKPVLVDLQANQPHYDLKQLAAAINSETVAVVAVNFLGIPAPLADIRALSTEHQFALIDDRAQSLPMPASCDATSYPADYIVLSFGKGKPLSLLGGGALFSRQPLSQSLRDTILPARRQPDWRVHSMYRLYNSLITPYCYPLLEVAPGLNLGATVYHPLSAITKLDSAREQLLMANLQHYQQQTAQSLQLQQQIQQLLAQTVMVETATVDLVGTLAQSHRLLRYPLLCANQQRRDALYQHLKQAGLGASVMYPAVLPEIDGVPECQYQSLAHARNFAGRLLTLPLHQHVRPRHLRAIRACLRST